MLLNSVNNHSFGSICFFQIISIVCIQSQSIAIAILKTPPILTISYPHSSYFLILQHLHYFLTTAVVRLEHSYCTIFIQLL